MTCGEEVIVAPYKSNKGGSRSTQYIDLPKLEQVRIYKDKESLQKDVYHRLTVAGKTVANSKKRENIMEEVLSDGGKIMKIVYTNNAAIVDKVLKVALRRYQYTNEHIMCNLEHTINVTEIVCAVIDALSSCSEQISRNDMLDKVIEKINDLRFHNKNTSSHPPEMLGHL